MTKHPTEAPEDDNKAHGFIDVLKSTFAAALGVQSNKNREKDFEKGSLKVFIAAGVIFTLVFIAVVLGVVKLALRGSGL